MSIERVKGVIATGNLPSAFPILEGLTLPGVKGLYGLTSPADAAETLGLLQGGGVYTGLGMEMNNTPAAITPFYDQDLISIALAVYTPGMPAQPGTLLANLGQSAAPFTGWRLSCGTDGGIRLSIANDAGVGQTYTAGGMAGGWTAFTVGIYPDQVRMIRSSQDYNYDTAYTRRKSNLPLYIGGGIPGSGVGGHIGTFGALVISNARWTTEEHRAARDVVRHVMASRGINIA